MKRIIINIIKIALALGTLYIMIDVMKGRPIPTIGGEIFLPLALIKLYK